MRFRHAIGDPLINPGIAINQTIERIKPQDNYWKVDDTFRCTRAAGHIPLVGKPKRGEFRCRPPFKRCSEVLRVQSWRRDKVDVREASVEMFGEQPIQRIDGRVAEMTMSGELVPNLAQRLI